jgi:hypothetical protein
MVELYLHYLIILQGLILDFIYLLPYILSLTSEWVVSVIIPHSLLPTLQLLFLYFSRHQGDIRRLNRRHFRSSTVSINENAYRILYYVNCDYHYNL